MHDPQTKYDCPVDKLGMQKALRENPDKENLYPVQVNSLKELLARQQTLREADKSLTEKIKREIKLA